MKTVTFILVMFISFMLNVDFCIAQPQTQKGKNEPQSANSKIAFTVKDSKNKEWLCIRLAKLQHESLMEKSENTGHMSISLTPIQIFAIKTELNLIKVPSRITLMVHRKDLPDDYSAKSKFIFRDKDYFRKLLSGAEIVTENETYAAPPRALYDKISAD